MTVPRTELREQAQEEVDRDVAAGHHPFTILDQFNLYQGEYICAIPFFTVTIPTNNSTWHYANRIKQLELEVLDLSKPYWDLAESHFKGKAHIRFVPRRILNQFCYFLTLQMCFNHVDDYETFKIMTKLHDLPECTELVFK